MVYLIYFLRICKFNMNCIIGLKVSIIVDSKFNMEVCYIYYGYLMELLYIWLFK